VRAHSLCEPKCESVRSNGRGKHRYMCLGDTSIYICALAIYRYIYVPWRYIDICALAIYRYIYMCLGGFCVWLRVSISPRLGTHLILRHRSDGYLQAILRIHTKAEGVPLMAQVSSVCVRSRAGASVCADGGACISPDSTHRGLTDVSMGSLMSPCADAYVASTDAHRSCR